MPPFLSFPSRVKWFSDKRLLFGMLDIPNAEDATYGVRLCRAVFPGSVLQHISVWPGINPPNRTGIYRKSGNLLHYMVFFWRPLQNQKNLCSFKIDNCVSSFSVRLPFEGCTGPGDTAARNLPPLHLSLVAAHFPLLHIGFALVGWRGRHLSIMWDCTSFGPEFSNAFWCVRKWKEDGPSPYNAPHKSLLYFRFVIHFVCSGGCKCSSFQQRFKPDGKSKVRR